MPLVLYLDKGHGSAQHLHIRCSRARQGRDGALEIVVAGGQICTASLLHTIVSEGVASKQARNLERGEAEALAPLAFHAERFGAVVL